jgi:hypothetical protein
MLKQAAMPRRPQPPNRLRDQKAWRLGVAIEQRSGAGRLLRRADWLLAKNAGRQAVHLAGMSPPSSFRRLRHEAAPFYVIDYMHFTRLAQSVKHNRCARSGICQIAWVAALSFRESGNPARGMPRGMTKKELPGVDRMTGPLMGGHALQTGRPPTHADPT